MTKKEKIIEIAGRLNIPPQWLSALIHLETAGTYNPKIKNPGSSARGLIQVVNTTARDFFGVSDSLNLVTRYPDFNSQMDSVVYPYLSQYAPFENLQQLGMSVLYPAYRDVPPNTPLPDWAARANPGIDTVADYTRLLSVRLGKWPPESKILPVAAIAAAATGAYLLSRKK